MQPIDGLIVTFHDFTLELPQSVLNWLGLCVLFGIFCVFAGKCFERADERKAPKGIVFIGEQVYNLAMAIIGGNLKHKSKHYLPFFGTLIVLMAFSNLLGLIGLQSPTSNVSINATLAIMMFLLIQTNAIKKGGLQARLKELCEPMWILTPLNIIGEFALPISLTMRLFGNILAGSIITLLIYTLLKLLMPIGVLGYLFTPFLHTYFDIFSGLIQTYIFFTLASFFLSEQVVEEG